MTIQPSTGPLYITVAELADRLRVSESTIYELVAQGHLGCYRIGARGRGTIRFTEAQVEAYLSSARRDDEKGGSHV